MAGHMVSCTKNATHGIVRYDLPVSAAAMRAARQEVEPQAKLCCEMAIRGSDHAAPARSTGSLGLLNSGLLMVLNGSSRNGIRDRSLVWLIVDSTMWKTAC